MCQVGETQKEVWFVYVWSSSHAYVISKVKLAAYLDKTFYVSELIVPETWD
jgi:hypothetical protein